MDVPLDNSFFFCQFPGNAEASGLMLQKMIQTESERMPN